jgi:uncharacterized repeat protein (TIGR01451 family)
VAAVVAAVAAGPAAWAVPGASAAPVVPFTVTSPAANATVLSRTVAFTGTGTPGSTVRVLDAGGTPVPGTRAATVGANTVWTATGTFPLTAPVTEHVTAEQTIGGARTGTDAVTLHLPGGPAGLFAVISPADNATSPSRTVAFTGTGTPGSTMRVLGTGGTPVSGTRAATVGANTVWTATGTFPLTAPVTEHVTAEQTTAGTTTGTDALTVHLPAPTYPLTTTWPANGSTVASRTVAFTGTGTPGSTVRVLGAGGTPVSGTGAATVASNGIWSTTGNFTASAPAIQHLTVEQRAGGSVQGTAALTMDLPAPAPAFAITSPDNGAAVASRTVAISGTGSPGSIVRVLGAGGTPVPGTGATTVAADGSWATSATFGATAPVTQRLTADESTGGAPDGTASVTIMLPSPVPSTPAISVTISTSPGSFSAAGQAMAYRYLVTNTGNVTLSSVGVTDTKVAAGQLSCPSSVITPGAGETCTDSYTTTQVDVDAGSVESTATATGTPPTGPPVTSPPFPVTVPGPPSDPAITLSGSASRSTFTGAGQAIVYRYLITNTGNVTLSSIAVTGTVVVPAGLRCPNPSLAPTASESCTGLHTTTWADVVARTVANTAVAIGTPPRGAAPVRSAPSLAVVPLVVIPVKHVTPAKPAVAHQSPVSPRRVDVTG